MNISRRFPDDSDQTPFVKMELSPAPAFCTGDAPNEDKSMPVYEWLARPNARAGLVEILHHSHTAHRSIGACRVLRTLRDWWYIDRISADQLTIEYVESSIDKWIVSSIQHYVRQKPHRSHLSSFQSRKKINSGKNVLLAKLIGWLLYFIMVLYISFLGWKIGEFQRLLGFSILFFVVVLFILAWITAEHKYIVEFKLWFRDIYYNFTYDRTTIIMFLSFLVTLACTLLPSPYGLWLALTSMAIGAFVGTYFYVRSLWENHVARMLWWSFNFFGSLLIIPLSKNFAGAAIERKTALSAESFSAAWDIVSLLYAIPVIFLLISFTSLLLYSAVVISAVVGKINVHLILSIIRLSLFILLIFMFAYFMVSYTEKRLLLYLDDIIAFTFVRNCQAMSERSAQNCICEALPESAYIHFYEGNNVVEAKLRAEIPPSNKDITSNYDFSYLGDAKSLGCVGISMWQM